MEEEEDEDDHEAAAEAMVSRLVREREKSQSHTIGDK
jgi:hypothetical protein